MKPKKMRRSRALRAARKYDCDLTVRVGYAVSREDLRLAMAATHDALIAETGDRRRSGVEWATWPATEADHMIELLELDDACRAEIGGWCAKHTGGTLVVAMCAARDPAKP